MEKAKKIAINAVIIAVIAILLIWGNTWQRQRAQFQRGEAALAAGDYIAAIAGYESAIHMYTPGSSLVEQAAERLWGLGEALERGGDPTRALVAYRALRSSFYGIQGLRIRGEKWIALCDRKIASLVQAAGQGVPERH